MFWAHLKAQLPLVLLLSKTVCQYIYTGMGRQGFAPKKIVIGSDTLLEIPRNHVVRSVVKHEVKAISITTLDGILKFEYL